jgi:hypothetical protein
MRDTIDMAREAGGDDWGLFKDFMPEIERLVALVRADEREQGQKWFDAVTAQHKQEILAEREACARLCDKRYMGDNNREDMEAKRCAAAIRARGQA